MAVVARRRAVHAGMEVDQLHDRLVDAERELERARAEGAQALIEQAAQLRAEAMADAEEAAEQAELRQRAAAERARVEVSRSSSTRAALPVGGRGAMWAAHVCMHRYTTRPYHSMRPPVHLPAV